jgi:hypothetical protein
LARVCVLYEDLRLELLAIAAESIPPLDILDPETENDHDRRTIGKSRKQYFLRRSIGSLCEFADALNLLSQCTELKALYSSWDATSRGDWDDVISFFTNQQRLIKDIRNDIGGHFGSKASLYVVEHLQSSAGKVEVGWNEHNQPSNMRLHFTSQLAATAFTRHLHGATMEEKVKRFFDDVLMPGYKHATTSVQMLVASELWWRFGR